MTERAIYLGAIEVLRRGGWCQHRMHTSDGAHCLLGAINVAAGFWLYPEKIYELVGQISYFNDHDCETIDDAIAALSIAADLAA